VPNDLHLRPEDGAQIQGFPLDREMHESLESRVRSYHQNEYLSPETLEWCEAMRASMKLPSPPLATEFVPFLGEYTIPDWYKYFVLTARQHHDNGLSPRLAVSPHPHGAWGWTTRQEVDEELSEGRDEYVNLEDLTVRRIEQFMVHLLIQWLTFAAILDALIVRCQRASSAGTVVCSLPQPMLHLSQTLLRHPPLPRMSPVTLLPNSLTRWRA
jgi:hypothetical protein